MKQAWGLGVIPLSLSCWQSSWWVKLSQEKCGIVVWVGNKIERWVVGVSKCSPCVHRILSCRGSRGFVLCWFLGSSQPQEDLQGRMCSLWEDSGSRTFQVLAVSVFYSGLLGIQKFRRLYRPLTVLSTKSPADLCACCGLRNTKLQLLCFPHMNEAINSRCNHECGWCFLTGNLSL